MGWAGALAGAPALAFAGARVKVSLSDWKSFRTPPGSNEGTPCG